MNIKNFINNKDYVDVWIHATHQNFVNENMVMYTKDSARSGAVSFVKPFNRPQLKYHDKKQDPVGRILDYEVMDKSDNLDEPQDFIKLHVRITDKDAMEKVVNGLYYSCSVGASSDHIRCSICDQVITRDGLCEHEKGSLVDGKRVYWIVDEIEYSENSFVNDPADPYSRIVSIDVGQGQVSYQDFLDNKESYIGNQINLEDSMTIKRDKLPANVFCGPGNTFPAVDAKHVELGLSLLDKAEFTDELKGKIKSALYRKGSRHGVEVADEVLESNPEIKTYRINDNFTDEEAESVTKFFEDNKDKDIVVEDSKEDNTPEETPKVVIEDLKKLKKDELIELVSKLTDEKSDVETKVTKLEDEKKVSNEKIKELNDSLSDKDAILNNKENEIIQMLDDIAKLELVYKTSLVDSIVHEKSNETNRDEITKKFSGRKIDSLVDTINDMRSETQPLKDEKVDDPTINKDENKTEGTTTLEDSVSDDKDDEFDVFYQ